VPEVPPTTSATNGTNGHPENLKPLANLTPENPKPDNPKGPLNVVAITNARIHTHHVSEHRARDDRAQGEPHRRPRARCRGAAGAQVIDAAGADVYPGFIDPSTALGLDEPGPRGFADTAESVEYNPHLRTRTAYHPDSEAIPVARANGVTTVGVARVAASWPVKSP
jgi:hypothetical protein